MQVRPTGDGDQDAALPQLSVPDADRLRAGVVAVLADRGLLGVAGDDTVRVVDGRVLGLWHLAAAVAQLPTARWQGALAAHVDRLVETPRPGDLDAKVVATTVRRLLPVAFAEGSGVPSRPAPDPSLVEVLSIELPGRTGVLTPQEEFWDDWGGVDRWWAVGSANLARVVDRSRVQIRRARRRRPYGAARGSSPFLGSLVLRPEIGSWLGEPDQGHGLLVTGPHRHLVAAQAVTRTRSLRDIALLMGFARYGADYGFNSLSPTVYWVHRARWTPVTRETLRLDDGRLGGPVADALGLSEPAP